MPDRWERLAETLLGHSLRLQPGETLLIESFDLGDHPLIHALISLATHRRARVLIESRFTPILRETIKFASDDGIESWAASDLERLSKVDACLMIRGDVSPFELTEVSPLAWNRYNHLYLRPVHWETRIPLKRWCLTRVPGPALAQQAQMTLDSLVGRFWDAVDLDYVRLERTMQPLTERLIQAGQVRIQAPGTDLSFSIAGVPAVPCSGRRNLPDGEVYTAPVLGTMRGVIRFNTRTFYQGIAFEGIEIAFEEGRCVSVDCRSGDLRRLIRILDADEGARVVGEWAIGCNPLWSWPVGDPLFDEKIAGSHHFALGFAYPDADNGNRSRIHWDLVQRLDHEHGGGRIELDGQPLVVDGLFVVAELEALNPL
jgi:aminopeptidase